MNRMKKAFTLIELLAVVVILSVIFTLTTPSIRNIIKNANFLGLRSNDQLIINAAKEYTTDYNTTFLKDLCSLGDTLYLDISALREKNLIDDIETKYTTVKISLEKNDKIKYSLTNDIPNSILLTLNPKGGVVSPTTKNVTYAGEFGILPTPTKVGHTFKGWYVGEDYSRKINATDVVRLSEPTTLYAKWVPNTYTITYYMGNATSTEGGNKIRINIM